MDVNSNQVSSENSDAGSDGDPSENGDNMEDEVEEGEIKSPVDNVPELEKIARSTSASQRMHGMKSRRIMNRWKT
ncbi:hypothetical protein Hanom_Chr04g00304571 [Helianthus anomalus]